jgi:hypothetical protein
VSAKIWRRSLAIAVAIASAATTAVAAASATATTATTTAAAVAAASAATTTATVAATTTTAASATTFTLRASFVDDERAAEKILAIKRGDYFFCFRIVANFRETEAARLTRETIAKQRERIGLHADFRE